jgi:hypothetical protein
VKNAQILGDKKVYWKSWQELFLVFKEVPYYPPMVIALIEIPGKGSDKWIFLRESMMRYPDNMELRVHAIFLLMNPRFKKLPKSKIPGILKELENSGWKPEIVSFLRSAYENYVSKRSASTLNFHFPQRLNYNDIFFLANNYKIHNEPEKALSIAKVIGEKFPAEPAVWLFSSNLYLTLKQNENSINSLKKAKEAFAISKRFQKPSDCSPGIQKYEEFVRKSFEALSGERNSGAKKDSLLIALDSLIYNRDLCGLDTKLGYLSSLTPFAQKDLINKLLTSQ